MPSDRVIEEAVLSVLRQTQRAMPKHEIGFALLAKGYVPQRLDSILRGMRKRGAVRLVAKAVSAPSWALPEPTEAREDSMSKEEIDAAVDYVREQVQGTDREMKPAEPTEAREGE